jgi:hypothetical protein
MTDEWSAMKDEQEDVIDVATATQRRPDFCAEALSPAIRIGLLCVALVAASLLFFVVLSLGIWPESGLLAMGEFTGVMIVGLWIGLTFITFLVYGALLGNNPRLTRPERAFWYTMFALAGPVMLPVYWFKEVWPVKYEPVIDERLAPARNPLPPYKREENETRVLAHP